MMSSQETYLKAVLKEIRFPFDRKAISKELKDHMDDAFENQLVLTSDPEEAMRLVLNDFGSPQEIGRQLNAVHKPILGWIWSLSRVMMLSVSILGLLMVGPRLLTVLQDRQVKKPTHDELIQIVSDPEIISENETLITDQKLDIRIKLKGSTLIFSRFGLASNGSLVLLYQEIKPLDFLGFESEDYPLISQSSLVDSSGQNRTFEADCVSEYKGFKVLVARNIDIQSQTITLNFEGYSETFSVDFKVDPS